MSRLASERAAVADLVAATRLGRPSARTLAEAMAIGGLVIALTIAGALGVRELIDTSVHEGFPAAWTPLLIAAFAPLAATALMTVMEIRAQRATLRSAARMTETTFRHLQHVRMVDIDPMSTGERAARVLEGPEELAQFIGWGIGRLGMAFAIAIATYGVGFALNWRLALLALAVIPVHIALTAHFNYGLRRIAAERRLAGSAEVSAFLHEHLSGIRLFQQHRHEPLSQARFDALSARVRTDRLREFMAGRVAEDFGIALSWGLGPLVVFGYGSYEFTQGRLTTGDIGALLSLVLAGLRVVQSSQIRWFDASAVFAAARRLKDTLAMPVEDDPITEALTVTRPPSVEFDDVEFTHRTMHVPVLRGLSMLVEPGKVVALVGASGCGKSTTAELLTRLFQADAGDVRLDDRRLMEWRLLDLRRTVGLAAQDPFFFNASVRANLTFGIGDVDSAALERVCRVAQIHDFIRSLPDGYETGIGERGSHLSGGERQRLSIARTLLRDPDVLILDEATSALDSVTERRVYEAVLAESTDRTILVIAHRLATVRNADRIFVLQNGQIVEAGMHADLLENDGPYCHLYERQTAGVS
ncbi:MAG: ABC transporter ATP-binding protein [Chloroflexota bacterium]|nr:ABC transporter ATP-binding protein [Chloroflexota bacterium]MDE2920299.1 ABC transporter ATP-binding protein [Chloroflexota bacterium]